MLCKLLVGLDGSPYSASAVALGIRWARQSGATLAGLGIVDEPTIRHPEAVPLGGGAFKEDRDETLMARAHRDVRQFLDEFAQQCKQEEVPCELLEIVGEPYEQIVTELQRHDLVILGQQTYFHFETQEGPDATLSDVLSRSPRAVVTVPEQLREGTSTLVAYDGSLQAARALHALVATGLHESSDVHVVGVNADEDVASAQVDRAIDYLQCHGAPTTRHMVASQESTPAVLLRLIDELDAGLLVMGAYGKATWREFFFGSVTTRMLKQSRVPLFLFH